MLTEAMDLKNGVLFQWPPVNLDPFLIADKLMHDEHYLVLKGYGWLLKVFSQYNEDAVFDYLMKHKQQMPRIAFRYALEKMPNEPREILMSKE